MTSTRFERERIRNFTTQRKPAPATVPASAPLPEQASWNLRRVDHGESQHSLEPVARPDRVPREVVVEKAPGGRRRDSGGVGFRFPPVQALGRVRLLAL